MGSGLTRRMLLAVVGATAGLVGCNEQKRPGQLTETRAQTLATTERTLVMPTETTTTVSSTSTATEAATPTTTEDSDEDDSSLPSNSGGEGGGGSDTTTTASVTTTTTTSTATLTETPTTTSPVLDVAAGETETATDVAWFVEIEWHDGGSLVIEANAGLGLTDGAT